jgi:acetyl-CoA carboxylase biotin carboxyl carrier protein
MTAPDPEPVAVDRSLVEALSEQAGALVRRLEGTSVQRLCVQAGDLRIEIERAFGRADAAAVVSAAATDAAGVAAEDGAAATDERRHAIAAPLVGRFYRASQPGAAPFVEPDDVVAAGQTLCIVEAMKMMNEVAADRSGRVVEILVENGEYVEFGQALMYLEPTDA